MRADVERNTASGTDGYGHAVKPSYTTLATVACWIYADQGVSDVHVVDTKKTGDVSQWRGLFPLDADIIEADEIANIKDRLGVTIIPGRFTIDGIFRKHRHIEIALLRVL